MGAGASAPDNHHGITGSVSLVHGWQHAADSANFTLQGNAASAGNASSAGSSFEAEFVNAIHDQYRDAVKHLNSNTYAEPHRHINEVPTSFNITQLGTRNEPGNGFATVIALDFKFGDQTETGYRLYIKFLVDQNGVFFVTNTKDGPSLVTTEAFLAQSNEGTDKRINFYQGMGNAQAMANMKLVDSFGGDGTAPACLRGVTVTEDTGESVYAHNFSQIDQAVMGRS